MYSIVYTKLSFSLLSQGGGTSWTHDHYSGLPQVNRLAEYTCIYTPCIDDT